jgi:hypothetical protein
MKGKMLTMVVAAGGVLALCLLGGYALGNRPKTMTFACVDAVGPDARVDLVGPNGDVLAENLVVLAFKDVKAPSPLERGGEVTVRLAPKEVNRVAEASKTGPVHALSHSLSTLLLGDHPH